MSLLVHKCKMIISPSIFFIFSKKKFWGGLSGEWGKIENNDPKWYKILFLHLISQEPCIYIQKKYNYPQNIVDQELEKVESSESSRITNKKDKCVFLVATYHPLLQTLVGFFINILIYFILIKNLKEFLHLLPWLHCVVQGKLAVI